MNIQLLIKETRDVHSHNTRASAKGHFKVKFCRTIIKKMSISFKGVKLWNELDKSIHGHRSLQQFTKAMKTLFIDSYN